MHIITARLVAVPNHFLQLSEQTSRAQLRFDHRYAVEGEHEEGA